MATTLRLLVFELIKYSPQRCGELLPCLQYHLRHHRVGQSQATPYRLVHGWVAALPTQRSLAPWATVPTALSEDAWLRAMIEGYKTITARFRAYLGDYEAKVAVRRDRTARWHIFRPQDYVMLERPPRAGDQSKGLIAAMDDRRAPCCLGGSRDSGPRATRACG